MAIVDHSIRINNMVIPIPEDKLGEILNFFRFTGGEAYATNGNMLVNYDFVLEGESEEITFFKYSLPISHIEQLPEELQLDVFPGDIFISLWTEYPFDIIGILANVEYEYGGENLNVERVLNAALVLLGDPSYGVPEGIRLKFSMRKKSIDVLFEHYISNILSNNSASNIAGDR